MVSQFEGETGQSLQDLKNALNADLNIDFAVGFTPGSYADMAKNSRLLKDMEKYTNAA